MAQRQRTYVAPYTVEGEFFEALPDGRVRCDLCPRHCTLHEGQRAFCFVREAKNGKVLLSSYGRSSGFARDPIEKKPLNHFYPGSRILSFGTAGCNLGCRFCQNWDISKAREVDRLGAERAPEAIADLAHEAGCSAVAFTYNDPVVFYEYAVDTAQACRERGLKTVAVSAGYITQAARPGFFAAMDATNIDLKAFSERFYHKLCFAHLDPVLDTLAFIKHETQTWLEVTTLLIPGENDTPDELARLCDWFAKALGPDTPLHFTAFHPDYKMRDKPATATWAVQAARAIARARGLRYVYTGNVHDPEGQCTYCPDCAACVIARDGYRVDPSGLRDGTCVSCGAAIAGHFW